MSEPPPQRIGDAERDRAAEYLREHLAQGRLTQEEFDDRVDAALRARTASDLTPLFTDLPAPRPDVPEGPAGAPWPVYQPTAGTAVTPAAPTPPPVRPDGGHGARALSIAAALAWPAWLMVMFAFNAWGSLWWLVFIPIMISGLAGKRQSEQAQLREAEQKRQLGP